jgi:hypothetical protein
MTHNQQVRAHGVERHGGIENRLALVHRGAANRHVEQVCAQPLAGKLKRTLGPGGVFEEQVDLGQTFENLAVALTEAGGVGVAVCQVEKGADFLRRQVCDAKQMPGFQDRGG